MPNRPLSTEDSFYSISEWLNQNIGSDSILPEPSSLSTVPKTKGIYFWFIHPNGYAALSKYVQIEAGNPRYEKEIDGTKYHLVYLGTAGTGKKGNSHLLDRFNWHIDKSHSHSNICHGTLSTLRAGLGALLADDLIEPNTGELITDFMKKHCRMFWLTYDDNKKEQIDKDEEISVHVIKPLLNLKSNPNAGGTSIDNPTKTYRKRRNFIYEKTRKRLNCAGESLGNQKEEKNPALKSISFENQILNEKDGCIEFAVTKDQSIATVIRGIKGLPKGSCKVICYNSSNRNQLVYAKSNGDGWRTTGNIYTYFANVDTSLNNEPRWLAIQNEMIENDIDEITVIVCGVMPKDGSGDKDMATVLVPVIPPNPPKVLSYANEIPSNKNDSKIKKYLIVISCCDTKIRGGAPRAGIGPLTYFENPINIPALPPLIANRALKIGQYPHINVNALLPAWERYNGHLYSRLKRPANQLLIDNLRANGCLDIIIISALYGVINYDTPISDYDLEMKRRDGNFWLASMPNAINQYCRDNNIDEVHTFLRLQTYYHVTNYANGLRQHIQSWPEQPNGQPYRSVPNIFNHLVDDHIIPLLNAINQNCF